jgi:hypothetical protein
VAYGDNLPFETLDVLFGERCELVLLATPAFVPRLGRMLVTQGCQGACNAHLLCCQKSLGGLRDLREVEGRACALGRSMAWLAVRACAQLRKMRPTAASPATVPASRRRTEWHTRTSGHVRSLRFVDKQCRT